MTTQAAHVCDFAFVNEVLADYRIHPGNQHSRMVLDKTGEFSTFEMLKMALNRPEYKYEKENIKNRLKVSVFLIMPINILERVWMLMQNGVIGLQLNGIYSYCLILELFVDYWEPI